jgi:hypothetical protein
MRFKIPHTAIFCTRTGTPLGSVAAGEGGCPLYLNHIIGVSPKSFQKIHRFQTAINKLLKSDPTDLTTVAQTHFIYDSKFFTNF